MFSAEWSKAKLMSQKDDDFTLQQRAQTKAGMSSSVVLSLLTLQLQSLKSDRGTGLVLSNCFVVFTVNFPENLSGTNSAISSVRGESTGKNSASCGSDLSLSTHRATVYNKAVSLWRDYVQYIHLNSLLFHNCEVT